MAHRPMLLPSLVPLWAVSMKCAPFSFWNRMLGFPVAPPALVDPVFLPSLPTHRDQPSRSMSTPSSSNLTTVSASMIPKASGSKVGQWKSSCLVCGPPTDAMIFAGTFAVPSCLRSSFRSARDSLAYSAVAPRSHECAPEETALGRSFEAGSMKPRMTCVAPSGLGAGSTDLRLMT